MSGGGRPRGRSRGGYQDQAELKVFVLEMDRATKAVGAPPVRKREEFLAYQKGQVEKIVELEAAWLDRLLGSSYVGAVYAAFFEHVETLPSIMSARSFFRERQGAFEDILGPAVRAKDWGPLTKYRVNYHFISWAQRTGLLAPPFAEQAVEIKKLREDMIVLLMPLAISRARIFWNRTPQSHLSISDLTQLSMMGLLVAVDKFVPPFSQVYRSVAIGRSTGNLIEAFTQTLLGFSSDDQRILYRANKIAGRMSRLDGIDFTGMVRELNAGAVLRDEQGNVLLDEAGKERVAFTVNEDVLKSLMAASSHVSSDAVEGVRRSVSRMAAPREDAPDARVEIAEGAGKIREVLPRLSLVQRKLLCLRGMISVEDV